MAMTNGGFFTAIKIWLTAFDCQLSGLETHYKYITENILRNVIRDSSQNIMDRILIGKHLKIIY